MKIKQFILILQPCINLLKGAGNAGLAKDIETLNNAWSNYEDNTVEQVLKIIDSNRPYTEGKTKNLAIAQVQNFFENLKHIFLAVKKKPIADDLDRLIEILEKTSGQTIAEVSDELDKVLTKSQKTSTSSSIKLNSKAVEYYLNRLIENTHDNTVFDKVILEIKSSKDIKANEMKRMAELFTKNKKKYKSKNAALEAIIQKQIMEANYKIKRDSSNQLQTWE